MPRLETDGATIDYVEGGSGAPLLLVQGSWLDRQQWELVRPGFERSFRTIAYSRRGHGQSTGGGALDADVQDLAALIEHLDSGPAHLIEQAGQMRVMRTSRRCSVYWLAIPPGCRGWRKSSGGSARCSN